MANTVIIGLDGIDWEYLEKFINEEELPHLRKIYEEGVNGNLRSIDPPISIPAWLCFSTGKKPDKMDLYNFTVREEGTYNMHKVHNSPDYQLDAFWKKLDNIGVVGVPSMFPVGDYDGFEVSGPLAPQDAYPEGMKKEVEKQNYSPVSPNLYEYDKCLNHLEKEGDFLSKQLREKNPEFFIGVSSVTDRVQHAFWTDEEKMKGLYKKADEQVGKILDETEEDTNVFVVSDHGFEEIEKTFYLNTWLREEGYLSTGDNNGSEAKEELRFRLKKNGMNILSKLGLLETAIQLTPEFIKSKIQTPEEIWDKIDWQKTKAFSSGQYVGQIYLNKEEYPEGQLSDEEYHKVRKEIVSKLKKLKDPETGEKVVDQIWTKDELYRDFAERAPDITFYPKDMKYKVKEELHSNVFDESIPVGSHGLNGVFLAKGPDIKEGNVDLNLIDVSSTVLHLEGKDIPEEMDGEVVKDIFDEDSDAYQRDVEFESDDLKGLDI